MRFMNSLKQVISMFVIFLCCGENLAKKLNESKQMSKLGGRVGEGKISVDGI